MRGVSVGVLSHVSAVVRVSTALYGDPNEVHTVAKRVVTGRKRFGARAVWFEQS